MMFCIHASWGKKLPDDPVVINFNKAYLNRSYEKVVSIHSARIGRGKSEKRQNKTNKT